MNSESMPPIRRIQVIGVSVFGAIAVICFVVSMLVAGGIADAFRTVAIVAAGICALIGVSFAVTGGSR